ncbi:MAG: acyltransferase family protein [bacterium]
MNKPEIMMGTAAFQNGNPARDSAGRLYYLDWLRVLAILLVFLVHCSKIFDIHTTVVFNAQRSLVLTAFREFTLIWIMPFFFLVSGAAIFLSYRFQQTGGFIQSRTRRILVPGLLVGTFVVNPPYVYIEKLFSGKTTSGFFQWYPHFFDGLYVSGKGNFAPWGMGTHLWYLQYLFIFSLILLPLFIRFKKSGVSLLESASAYFENPWALFLLFLPVSAAAAMFEVVGLGGVRVTGGWDMISYMLFLGYGYLIYANARIQETIRQYSPVFLAAALILTVIYLDAHFGVNLRIPGVTRHDLVSGELLPSNRSIWAIVQAYRGLAAWCWMIALLGFGRRFLNFNSRLRTYANEAVLPFYILHHTVIYIVGFYVIQWNAGVGITFIVLSIVSFAGIMGIYEVLIRRVNLLRILFGMKSKKIR